MDANRTSTSFADPWLENFSRVLEEHRTRFAAALAAQQQRWKRAHAQLVAEIDAWEQDRDRGHPAEHDDEAEDFRRRYELALDDIHQLRSRNASLQNQVAQLERQQTQEPASGGLDWEAEKRRIFAALDRGFGQDEAAELERLRVEEVVRLTDQAVAEKDQQIAELQTRLQTQQTAATAAIPAAETLLDHDALIRQERENLLRLQEECREKLRAAEIAVARERAEIARQRAQLDAAHRKPEDAGVSPSTILGKPGRGRWLAHLGLKEHDDASG